MDRLRSALDPWLGKARWKQSRGRVTELRDVRVRTESLEAQAVNQYPRIVLAHLTARDSRAHKPTGKNPVSFHTNRYSVPFTLIGKTVELERRGDVLVIHHHGDPVATHPVLTGRHQLAIAPEHGPGAIARNPRRIRATLAPCRSEPCPDVEIRNLAVYDALMEVGR